MNRFSAVSMMSTRSLFFAISLVADGEGNTDRHTSGFARVGVSPEDFRAAALVSVSMDSRSQATEAAGRSSPETKLTRGGVKDSFCVISNMGISPVSIKTFPDNYVFVTNDKPDKSLHKALTRDRYCKSL
jgi:hypothetical protein